MKNYQSHFPISARINQQIIFVAVLLLFVFGFTYLSFAESCPTGVGYDPPDDIEGDYFFHSNDGSPITIVGVSESMYACYEILAPYVQQYGSTYGPGGTYNHTTSMSGLCADHGWCQVTQIPNEWWGFVYFTTTDYAVNGTFFCMVASIATSWPICTDPCPDTNNNDVCDDHEALNFGPSCP